MRSFSPAYTAANNAQGMEPRWAVSIGYAAPVWITSHSDVPTPAGETVLYGLLSESNPVSPTSQRLLRDEFRSQPGLMTVEIVDVAEAFSALVHGKLVGGEGLREKQVQLYIGAVGLEWDQYAGPMFTQYVTGHTDDDGKFVIRCGDVQRFLQNKIFVTKSTNLKASIGADDLLIPVYEADLEVVHHGPAYSDAPNSNVLYFDIGEETIRATGSTVDGTLGLCYVVDGATGRGALGTSKQAHEVDAASERDQRPQVKERVFLEGPVAKVIYQVMTGVEYGTAYTLPAHWHAHVDPSQISTAAFITLGKDVWDPADDYAGMPCRIDGWENENCKEMIEQELLPLIGCFFRVRDDGQLGIQHRAAVVSGAATVGNLTLDNVQTWGALKYNDQLLQNHFQLFWNYNNRRTKKFNRDITLKHQTSIDTFGGGDKPRIRKMRALHGSMHATPTLYRIFDKWVDAYSAPPITLDGVVLSPEMIGVEVGDVLQVTLPIRNTYTNADLDLAMEVQSVSLDVTSGAPTVNLFGSAYAAGAVPRLGEAQRALAVSQYAVGTDITTVPGITTNLIGDVMHITGYSGAALTGVYHYDGNLTLDAGVTIPISGDFQLRVNGDWQRNGKLDGKGLGTPGVARPGDPPGYIGIDAFKNDLYNNRHTPTGTSGYFGDSNTRTALTGGIYKGSLPGWTGVANRYGSPVYGTVSVAPQLSLSADSDGTLVGLPPTMQGTAGGPGADIAAFNLSTGSVSVDATGSDGASGGASCTIICHSSTVGASSDIDLSGNVPAWPEFVWGPYGTTAGQRYAGMGGEGLPGVYLLVIDGNAVLDDEAEHFTATSTRRWPTFNRAAEATKNEQVVDHKDACFRVVYLQAHQSPAADIPTYTNDVLDFTATVLKNTPPSQLGDQCSIEVTVAPPAVTHYDYANIYHRVKGQTTWSQPGPANDEWVITPISASGTTYEIQARAVSINGNESKSGPIKEVAVPKLIAPSVDDPSPITILPIPKSTGLCIAGQANDTEWIGRDINTAWNRTAASAFVELGYEEVQGPSGVDSYIHHYEVEIKKPVGNDAVSLDTYNVYENWDVFTYDQNAELYKQHGETGTDHAYRDLYYCVTQVGYNSAHRSEQVCIRVTNPAPTIGAVSVVEGLKLAMVSYTPSTDRDSVGVDFYLSTTPGFTADETTLVLTSTESPAKLQNLQTGTQYYLRYQPRDAFGPGALSTELSFTTGAFIEAGAAEHIAGLLIVDGTYNVTAGAHSVGGAAALLSSSNGAYHPFALYEDGSARLGGIGGNTILLDGGNKRITIGSETFGGEGVQIEYNAGSPRIFIGGANGALQYDAVDGLRVDFRLRLNGSIYTYYPNPVSDNSQIILHGATGDASAHTMQFNRYVGEILSRQILIDPASNTMLKITADAYAGVYATTTSGQALFGYATTTGKALYGLAGSSGYALYLSGFGYINGALQFNNTIVAPTYSRSLSIGFAMGLPAWYDGTDWRYMDDNTLVTFGTGKGLP